MNAGFAGSAVRGGEAAALLLSDYAIVSPSASIDIDSPEAWAGAVWRIGDRALRLHIEGKTHFTAAEALEAGLVDAIAESAGDVFENRSGIALDSGASLITRRGGDMLERAEFARLFAIGEPQKGLRAFLQRRKGMPVAENP